MGNRQSSRKVFSKTKLCLSKNFVLLPKVKQSLFDNYFKNFIEGDKIDIALQLLSFVLDPFW